MPALLVRLKGAAIPLEGELRRARTGGTWRERVPSAERFRPNCHASPFRPI